MRAARRGDARAYERLLVDVAARLRVVVRRRLSGLRLDRSEAEDIVQETLMALHGKRHTWDERRPITPWIHAIARHKALDAARRLGRRRRSLVDLPIEDFADVLPDDYAFDEGVIDLEQRLAKLPERQHGVVRALGVEGASISEAAARLSVSEGAVRVAWHRGLSTLRARFAE